MRILYGVTGEGLGHTMRAGVLIDHLITAGHEVQIAASGRAARLLARDGADVVTISGLSIVYEDGAVERLRTLGRNAKGAPHALARNAVAAAAVLRFDPELVLTDFDSFSYAIGRFLDRPIVSIDHQHVLSRFTHAPRVLRELSYDQRMIRGFVRRKLPRCDRYIVTSFFFPEVERHLADSTRLVGPIVRPAALQPTDAHGDHVLVYQSGGGDPRLLEMLGQLPEFRFRIYGAGVRKGPAHVEYLPFSEAGFLADLASARVVVANGGYTTLSEALCLGRPVVSIPIRHQCEQELNAAYLAHDGHGVGLRHPTPTSLRDALRQLSSRGPRTMMRAANDDATRELDAALREVA